VPEGVLTFKRQVIPEEEIPRFKDSKKSFRKAIIKLDGTSNKTFLTKDLNYII
jgi:hypothetical protein